MARTAHDAYMVSYGGFTHYCVYIILVLGYDTMPVIHQITSTVTWKTKLAQGWLVQGV